MISKVEKFVGAHHGKLYVAGCLLLVLLWAIGAIIIFGG